RKTLGQKLWQNCSCCQGTGKMLSLETLAVNFFRRLREEFWDEDFEAVEIKVNPELLMKLVELGEEELKKLEEELEMTLYILKDEKLFLEDIDIVRKGSKEEIESYIPVAVNRQLTLKLEETPAGLITSVDGYLVKVTGKRDKNQSSAKVKIKELGPSHAVSEIVD
ncbi:MAG: hypothetical protein R6V17_08790, partial [Halanaerobacter sp.]